MSTTTITIRLTEQEKKTWKRLSADERRTLSGFVKWVIAEYGKRKE